MRQAILISLLIVPAAAMTGCGNPLSFDFEFDFDFDQFDRCARGVLGRGCFASPQACFLGCDFGSFATDARLEVTIDEMPQGATWESSNPQALRVEANADAKGAAVVLLRPTGGEVVVRTADGAVYDRLPIAGAAPRDIRFEVSGVPGTEGDQPFEEPLVLAPRDEVLLTRKVVDVEGRSLVVGPETRWLLPGGDVAELAPPVDGLESYDYATLPVIRLRALQPGAALVGVIRPHQSAARIVRVEEQP